MISAVVFVNLDHLIQVCLFCDLDPFSSGFVCVSIFDCTFWLSCLCGRQCFVGAIHCNCKCGCVLKVRMFWIDNLSGEVA